MKKSNYVPEQVANQLAEYYQNGFDQLFANGHAMQDEVLQDIIELGRNSDYAKDKGFADIKTKEEFWAKVPVSEYEDYRMYVERNMKKDNKQLTDLETEYYLLSTGYSDRGKCYIETHLGALARQLSIDIWNMALTKTEPIMVEPTVKMLAVTNCSPIDQAPNGKDVRRTSGQAAKTLWERNPQLYVFPYEFLEATMSNEDRDYLTALYTLKEKNFNMLFCNNLAYFGVILDYIKKYPQRLIEDIRNGHMTADLKETDRVELERNFLPDSARAEELQHLLEQYGELSVEHIWPNFVFTGAWLAGSVGRLAQDVMRQLPEDMHYLSESYGASEAMFTIPMELNCAYGPLAVYSCYFEFLPLDKSSGPVAMTEVKDGAYYELVITTYSGLYRYNLHDIVRIQGFTGTTANVEFCCRSSEVYSLNNRVVYGYELMEAMEEVEQQETCLLSLYQGYVEDGKLSLLLQLFDQDCAIPDFLNLLQTVMAKKDIPLGKVYFMHKNYRDALYHSLMKNGRTIQSIKLPLITYEKPAAKFVYKVYDFATDL